MASLSRPTLILPDGLTERICDSQLRDVLVHELAYIAGGFTDIGATKLGGGGVLAPSALSRLESPTVRARKRFATTISRGSDAPQFSRTLLTIAEFIQDHAVPPMSLAMFTSKWRLESRVAGLLIAKRNRLTQLSRRGKAAVVGVSLVLTALAAYGTLAFAQSGDAKTPAANTPSPSNVSPPGKAAPDQIVQEFGHADLIVQKVNNGRICAGQDGIPESLGVRIRKLPASQASSAA